MLTLSKKSLHNIGKHTSIKPAQIPEMTFNEIESKIGKLKKKRISLNNVKDERLIGRGSVYIYLQRFLQL